MFFFPAIQGMFPEIVGFPPKSSNLIGVFHYFHHPFWGTSIFGNTHIITNFHGWKMSKKSIFSAVIFAKRPAGLLAGKIWCQRRRQIGIPIGFIGWERLGKRKGHPKMENCDIFLQRKLIGLWNSNFEWKFRMGKFQTTNCWSSKEWHFRSHLLEEKMGGEESPRKHTKRDIKHQPTNQWKDMFGCLT